MNRRRFLSYIRQYAAIAQYRRKSYASLILSLISAYSKNESNAKDDLDGAESLERWAFDVALREYSHADGRFPSSWEDYDKITTIPF